MAVVVTKLDGLMIAKDARTRRFGVVAPPPSCFTKGFSILEFDANGEVGVIGWASTQVEARAFVQGFDHGVRRADETRDADAPDRQ